MKEQKLLVKQLSNTGELIRVISCFAGQISVFRATSPNALRPFQRAFVGLPGPEKIVISIEDENYVPSEHPLIGFGERWNASEKNQSDE